MEIRMLEIYVITILAVLFTVTYAVGSRWNYKIQKEIWATLSREIKPYCRSVAFKGFGSSGFKIGCKPTAGPFTKLEVSIILLSREMLLYYLTSKCGGKRDRIVIKSNFRRPPNFALEIIKRGSKLHKGKLKAPELKEIQQEKLSEDFFICCSRPSLALKFLSNRNVVLKIRKLSSHIERLSITKEEPHLLLSCKMEETNIPQLLSLASLCGKAILSMTSGGT